MLPTLHEPICGLGTWHGVWPATAPAARRGPPGCRLCQAVGGCGAHTRRWDACARGGAAAPAPTATHPKGTHRGWGQGARGAQGQQQREGFKGSRAWRRGWGWGPQQRSGAACWHLAHSTPAPCLPPYACRWARARLTPACMCAAAHAGSSVCMWLGWRRVQVHLMGLHGDGQASRRAGARREWCTHWCCPRAGRWRYNTTQARCPDRRGRASHWRAHWCCPSAGRRCSAA